MKWSFAPLLLLVSCSSSQLDPEASRSSPLRVVFIAGGPSHGPGEHEYRAGSLLLARLLQQLPEVSTEVLPTFPESLAALDSANAVVLFTDGNVGHPLLVGERMDQLRSRLADGMGLVCLHWSTHVPEQASAAFLPLLGGHYADPISVNPIWLADFDALADHAVTRGVSPFQLQDEIYYNLRFVSGGTLAPLLSATPPDDTRFTTDAASHPGRSEVVAWAFERDDGGRSFGFTGAHYHENWGIDPLRRLVLNAIWWSAGRDVPATGIAVDFDPAWLAENLDPKPL